MRNRAGERGDHLNGLLLPPGLGHPDDGIQRIVEEVRVDLRLQHLEFAAALLALLLDDVVHQMVHGGHHRAHRMAQALHLVAAGVLDLHVLPSAFQLLDGLLQAADGVGDIGGDAEVEESHQKHKEKDERQAEQEQLGQFGALVGGDADQLPAGVAHGLDRDMALFALKALQMVAVRISSRLQVVFLEQARVDQLAAGDGR